MHLSSQDSLRDDALEDLTSSDPSLEDLKKQGVTHIPFTAEQVLQSDGEERWKWMQALDVIAAFLNAPLPKGRIVMLRPRTVLYKLQLLPPGHVWLVHKAIYGLREAPQLWSEERTETITKTTFASEEEQYCILLSEIHKSLCLITRKSSLLKKPSTDKFGLTSKVLPHEVVALSGIYVNDFLTTGPPRVAHDFTTHLRKLRKTSSPQYLSLENDLILLGVTIKKLPERSLPASTSLH